VNRKRPRHPASGAFSSSYKEQNMNIVQDDQTLAAALAEITDTTLRAVLNRIVGHAKAAKLWDVTCIVIVDPADTGEEIEHVLGFDPLLGPLGDAPGAWWAHLTRHVGWFEILHMPGT
jgi:hypothetical protein